MQSTATMTERTPAVRRKRERSMLTALTEGVLWIALVVAAFSINAHFAHRTLGIDCANASTRR